MPLYEYGCKKCHKRSERIENHSGPHLKKCPHCGGAVERVLSAPAIQFKGSGWYVTDYAGKSSPKSETPKGESKPGAEGSASPEGKSKESSAIEKKTEKKKQDSE